jgi:hypothetical protein
MPFVYAIREAGETGLVKIGFSKNPKTRLHDMQVGNPRELYLLACKRGTRQTEFEIHVKCRHLRIRGEWFRLGDPLNSIITGMRQMGDTPDCVSCVVCGLQMSIENSSFCVDCNRLTTIWKEQKKK